VQGPSQVSQGATPGGAPAQSLGAPMQTPVKKGNAAVFGAVMQPPATGAKVYASVYSGVS